MGQMLIRQLDQDVVERLKARAKANRRSTEAEVRAILEDVVKPSGSAGPALKSFVGAASSRDSFKTLEEIVSHIRTLRDEQDD